ncbi:MAG: FIST N-terminal domain-containing protein [Planctomycetota bacterium]
MHRYGSGSSTLDDLDRAMAECLDRARPGLAGAAPDLALVFATRQHDAERLSALLRAAAPDALRLGCAAEAVLGREGEHEGRPGLSVLLAAFDQGVELRPMRLDAELRGETEHGQELRFTGHEELEGVEDGFVMLIADPFRFPVEPWLRFAEERFPTLPVFGGVSSGGMEPGLCKLLDRGGVADAGAVALLFRGLPLRTVVSQGCRPIGQSWVVTKAHKNLLLELGGKPAMERLQEVYVACAPEEQERIRRGGLHVGLVVDEHKSRPGRGDFLVRNLMGSDPESGAIAIGDFPVVGRTLRFHLRDAGDAGEDLEKQCGTSRGAVEPGAAVLFTCNGRGRNMFQEDDHDVRAVLRGAGDLPVAGFFAGGEIGPVGGKSFLHGFTASVVLLPR